MAADPRTTLPAGKAGEHLHVVCLEPIIIMQNAESPVRDQFPATQPKRHPLTRPGLPRGQDSCIGSRLPHLDLKVFGQRRPIIDQHKLTGRNGLSPDAFQALLQIVRPSGREQKDGDRLQGRKSSGLGIRRPDR